MPKAKKEISLTIPVRSQGNCRSDATRLHAAVTNRFLPLGNL